MKWAVTILIFSVASLAALGMVILYSSGMGDGNPNYLTKQLTWFGVGMAGFLIASLTDYRFWKRLAWPILGLALLLLVAVLLPHIGIYKNGARHWLGYGGFTLQPSEVAKLALIIALAAYGARNSRQMPTLVRGLVVPLIFSGLILGLIFVEPDRGTAILLGAVTGLMLLIAGVRWVFIFPPGVLALLCLGFSLWHDPLRRTRIFGWMYLEQTKSGVSYQAYQAMVTLGSGGWAGLGLGNGRQKLGFLPEHHTDFIFSVIGEELGLIATLAVIVLFILLVFAGVYIAWNAADSFGLLLGSGLTFLIGLQAFINIGVVTSALPNKGLPLPFISYGGSNLMIMLTAVGLLLSIARHAVQRGQSTNPAMVKDLNSRHLAG